MAIFGPVLKFSHTGPSKRHPDVVYNTDTGHFFVVWQESELSGETSIQGELRYGDGDPIGPPILISRSAPQCLPSNFFERIQHPRYDYTQLPLPNRCPENFFPSVSYNPSSGYYMVAWQAEIVADYPRDYGFAVIQAQAYSEENGELSPVWTDSSGNTDPIVVSRYFVGVHVAQGTERHEVQTEEIVAWSSARHPQVEPATGRNLFLISYITNNPMTENDYPACRVEGEDEEEHQQMFEACRSQLEEELAYYGVQVRPLQVRDRDRLYPLPLPYLFRDPSSARLTNFYPVLSRRQEEVPSDPEFLLAFETINRDQTDDRYLRSVAFAVNDESFRFHAPGSSNPVASPQKVGVTLAADPDDPTDETQLREALLKGEIARVHHAVSSTGYSFPYKVVYRFRDDSRQGLDEIGVDAEGRGSNLAVILYEDSGISDEVPIRNSAPVIGFSRDLQGGERRHLLVSRQNEAIKGLLQTPESSPPPVSFPISDPEDRISLNVDPVVEYAERKGQFYVVWAQLAIDRSSKIMGQYISLTPPSPQVTVFGFKEEGTCHPWSSGDPVKEIRQNEVIQLCWETENSGVVEISVDNDSLPPAVHDQAIEGDQPLPVVGEGDIRPLLEEGDYIYTLLARGPLGEEVTRTLPLQVNPYPLPVIQSFTINGASQATIRSGESVTLTWQVQGEEGDQVHIRIVDSQGRLIVQDSQELEAFEIDSPPQSTTYSLTATGFGGSPSPRDVSVTVSP
ncbi:MAG: hypothetical protein HYS22_08600 [Deltaproteobacteria bacterium]|nr:hypothetical protein [Deltaproteobacteria bacterium]